MAEHNIFRISTKSRLGSLSRILLVFVTVGLLAIPPALQADGGFDTASVAGTWAFTADGTIVPDGIPVALVGTATFEDDGQCSLTDFLNIGGTSFTTTSFTCTLTVNSDGTGSIEADFGGPFSPEVLSIVIVDEDEILVVRTDLIVARGSFKRQAGSDGDDDD